MHVLIRSALFVATLGVSLSALAGGQAVTVYQDPNCGCCHGWAEHMRAEGFEVQEIPTTDMAAIKARLGVPMELASCHTARIEASGQIIEGHVPASAVRKLLASSQIRGVSAPGMPLNSPGMGALDGNLVTVDFDGQAFSKD
ncbi:DUF411 domain-containing protein [Castellaniella sp.]|uniref:DUF411 domain-containing protein n=1 Tax=Castellaniella sp. TaxID=1955812 RepID=UPI002AFE3774|nr:DUF411 domain-containing protein [Castellaniella sp.]